MHCETFDHEFRSLMYKKTWINNLYYYHNDYMDLSCQVVIYGAERCTGDGWSFGQNLLVIDQCLAVPPQMGTAKSVGVVCSEGVAIPGYVEEDQFYYKTYQG